VEVWSCGVVVDGDVVVDVEELVLCAKAMPVVSKAIPVR
jgi:hypothetical protein